MTEAPLIAVIDDDTAMRRSLDGLIRSLGYRVILFDSAEAFLLEADTVEVACVISDVHMPGMGGISLVKKLSPRLKGRVILISANLSQLEREEARSQGVKYILNKPFDGEDLIACIENSVEI